MASISESWQPTHPTGKTWPVEIRDAKDDDWPGIWSIVQEVLAEGDSYTYDPDMTEDEARDRWMAPDPWLTRVATTDEGVIGVATMGPNQAGPGSHISNANFAVSRQARGNGVGSALVEDTLDRAQALGYAGMQFNGVTETNTLAVGLYQRLGFEIIGTVPGAFMHPTLGPVGLHVMFVPF